MHDFPDDDSFIDALQHQQFQVDQYTSLVKIYKT